MEVKVKLVAYALTSRWSAA